MTKGLHIAFLLIGLTSFGQKLDVQSSEEKILIGEPIMLTYRVILDANSNIDFKPDTDDIDGRSADGGELSSDGFKFEIVEEFTDTVKFKQKEKEWLGRYTVTIWDSGTYILPGPNIVIDDSTYRFKDLTLYATYSPQVKGVDIYDIHENFADIPDKPFSITEFLQSNWWWILILILVPLVYFIVKRAKKEKVPKPLFKAMSLKERTLLAIDALDNEKMWEKDKLKEHFVELSYILRSYLTTRYNLSLLEKTTYQTKLLLTQKGLNEDTVDNIARILSESDLVKFAKSKPEVISILRVSTLARQIVAETSPLEFDNVE